MSPSLSYSVVGDSNVVSAIATPAVLLGIRLGRVPLQHAAALAIHFKLLLAIVLEGRLRQYHCSLRALLVSECGYFSHRGTNITTPSEK